MGKQLGEGEIVALLTDIRPEADFAASTDFLEDGLLDSTDIVALVATLDKAYGISIDGTDILPEHFKNSQAIESLLDKYGVKS